MYQANYINYRVRDKIILRDVSLSVAPGRFTAVVGPNGAGKSTLLKIMAGEVQGFHGEVNLNGKAMKAFRAHDLSRLRAVLPQTSSMQFAFTAEQVIALGRHAHRVSRKDNERVLAEVIDLTGVAPFCGRSYLTLSGGEKQRVQLARVLAQVWEETVYPRYILLDEPTSSLDIAQQQLIFGLTRQVSARNIGVMAIVHDLNQAVQFADHIYFMRRGQITAGGATRDVFTKFNIEETFGCHVNVYHDPSGNCPYIIPSRGAESAGVLSPLVKTND